MLFSYADRQTQVEYTYLQGTFKTLEYIPHCHNIDKNESPFYNAYKEVLLSNFVWLKVGLW